MHTWRFRWSRALCAAVVGGLIIPSALADWDPGDGHKMVDAYPPDLSTNGLDMNVSLGGSSGRYILFDDFYCDQTGPITDIHLWGSWKDDLPPDGDADNVTFILSLHENVNGEPDITGGWVKTFNPGAFTSRAYATGLQEGWATPGGDYQFPGDTVCWQYNFQIDPAEAFVQTYDEHYWLSVTAIPADENALFGWKTTPIDAAGRANNARWTWELSPWDDLHQPMGAGNSMVYPEGHPYGPPNGYDFWNAEPLNLAFVITPEPSTLGLLALGGPTLFRRRRADGSFARESGAESKRRRRGESFLLAGDRDRR